MGTWTLARWQRFMAALAVLGGAAINVAIVVFHVNISGEGTTAIVALISAGGVALGWVLFAGDSTPNAEVQAHAMALARGLSTQAFEDGYSEGHGEGHRVGFKTGKIVGLQSRPLPEDSIEPFPTNVVINPTPLIKTARDYKGEI